MFSVVAASVPADISTRPPAQLHQLSSLDFDFLGIDFTRRQATISACKRRCAGRYIKLSPRRGKMRNRLVAAASLVAVLSLSPGIANAVDTPSPTPEATPAVSPAGTTALVLPREQQPKHSRPTLDKISQEARAKGIPFKKALDKYAAETVQRNPAAQPELPDGPVPDPVIKIDGIPFAELIDLNRLATSRGISLEEAIDRYAWVPAVDKVGIQLNKDFPEALSGITFTNEGRSLHIGFKGEIPRAAINLAKTLPGEVEFIGGKGFSEAELKSVRDTRFKVLAGRPEVEALGGGYDIETGRVTFKAQLRPSISATEKDRARTALQPAPADNSNISIDVTVVDDLGIKLTDNYLRGGGFLTLNSLPWCTAGFNIISTSDVRATTTAKHCADDSHLYLTYENHHDYDTNRTTVSRMFRSPAYDFARYQGGDLTYTRTFYYELNTPRYVTALGIVTAVGRPICSFGRTSAEAGNGARCGTVTDTDYTYMSNGVIHYDAYVTDYTLLGGDSGGPSYWGGSAYGLNSATNGGESYIAKTENFREPDGFGSSWDVWQCGTC
ncbi:S1 family peptidase [Nonomuraea sp. NEAU-A123]|uniref:S1 family peptidase n=1 Tax=Nonomuraea sp. NEAU-A123 TaxID=2839649 RepID=UPI001BE49F0B|nr:S1 family peptidase [Nonomuraea sp. NEAU-A123]MBT2233214.1 hypothetical protein [Nonomuraea sp. NEAU-A123]